MKRGWWKGLDDALTHRPCTGFTAGTDGRFTKEQAQHVVDAFELLEKIYSTGTRWSNAEIQSLLNRGEEPMAEWGPEGVGPDSRGTWERVAAEPFGGNKSTWYVDRTYGQWCMSDKDYLCPIHMLDHRGWRYRKVSE